MFTYNDMVTPWVVLSNDRYGYW